MIALHAGLRSADASCGWVQREFISMVAMSPSSFILGRKAGAEDGGVWG